MNVDSSSLRQLPRTYECDYANARDRRQKGTMRDNMEDSVVRILCVYVYIDIDR
jgi:hypothetical protein